MIVHESKFLVAEFIQEHQLIITKWLPETEKMSTEEYKVEFLKFKDLVLQYRSKRIIADERDMHFLVTPELQAFIDKEVFTFFVAEGLNKEIAVVFNEDIILQLAAEQLMDETEGQKMNTRFFSEVEEAKAWLLSLVE